MNKKAFFIFLFLVAISGIFRYYYYRYSEKYNHWSCEKGIWRQVGQPRTTRPEILCENGQPIKRSGKVVNLDNRQILVRYGEGVNDMTSFQLAADSKILDKTGKETGFDYIHLGFLVEADGIEIDPYVATTKEIRIIEEPNIIVYLPVSNGMIGLPLVVRGEARVFENVFSYRLKDADGALLMENSGIASSSDTGRYGFFQVSAAYSEPKVASGTVEVFEYSAKDGSEINKVIVPVRFKAVESMAVKAFFSNRLKDSDARFCEKVYPVERRIKRTKAAVRAAMNELLAGAQSLEARNGFYSNIDAGTGLKSVNIKDGQATVDLEINPAASIAGSCRVLAIRAQIEETLKQFKEVKEMKILVNGRENALEP